MPGRQGELRGDDRRPAAVSLLENFEQIVTGAGVEGFEAEVVENEQIGAAEGFDEARMAAVASGERHVLAELWPAMITTSKWLSQRRWRMSFATRAACAVSNSRWLVSARSRGPKSSRRPNKRLWPRTLSYKVRPRAPLADFCGLLSKTSCGR